MAKLALKARFMLAMLNMTFARLTLNIFLIENRYVYSVHQQIISRKMIILPSLAKCQVTQHYVLARGKLPFDSQYRHLVADPRNTQLVFLPLSLVYTSIVIVTAFV